MSTAETSPQETIDKKGGKSIECFGETVLSPDDIRQLKGNINSTLRSDEPDKIYRATEQLASLRRAGLKVRPKESLIKQLQSERQKLEDSPYKLARFLVHLNYLGVIEPKDITDKEKELIAKQLEVSVKDPKSKYFAEFCVSAKRIGVDITNEAQERILSEINELSNKSQGNTTDRYIKRLAQAKYLGINTAIDESSVHKITEDRMQNHYLAKNWTSFARLQSFYTRATGKNLSLRDEVKSNLIKHAATLINDAVRIGRYLGDLKIIEKTTTDPIQNESSSEPSSVNSDSINPDGLDFDMGPLEFADTPAPAPETDTPEQNLPEAAPKATEEESVPIQIAPENPESREANLETESVFIASRLDNPFIMEGLNGEIACGTDEGFIEGNPVNEDGIVINKKKNAFAVIDGMGGPGRGEVAMIALALAFQEGFEKDLSFEEIQQKGHELMRRENLYENGACYIAGLIDHKNTLHIAQAGDVRLIIIHHDGKIFETKDECMPPPKENHVTNCVQGRDRGNTTLTKFRLERGDRIIVASDGLWDNLYTNEVANLVKEKSAAEAIKILEEQTRIKMQAGRSREKHQKPDNRSIFIYDFTAPEEI